MKKLFAICIICMLMISLTACGSNGNTEAESTDVKQTEQTSTFSEQTSTPSEQASENSAAAVSEATEEQSGTEAENNGSDILVVYFSATGNTKAVAEAFAAALDADIYEIVPEQPYTEEDLNYNDRSTRATMEQNDTNARPAILGGVENMEAYDVIYVGFPIWWGDMPRILYTFFDSYDLSGKTIAPFATSGGSGISRAVQSIEELEPDALVTEGLLTSPSDAESDLPGWLEGIGLAE